MLRWFKRNELPIAIVLTVAIPLLVYASNAKDPGEANVIDKIVLAATGPLRSLMLGTVGLVSDSWRRYVDVVGARKENAELELRVRELERELDRLVDLRVENDHLAMLLDIDGRNPDLDLVAARVVGAGLAPSSRTVQIDAGSMDGIRRGQPVIDGRGLVGVVHQVGWTQAEVTLIADDRSRFHVSVARTRARGRVRGLGLAPGFKVQLTEVLRSDDVKKGDQVFTNGLGGVYPRGIPVGFVTNVRSERGVQHRVADIVPYVDFARLETVAVITNDPPPKIIATPEPLLPASLQTETSTPGVDVP